MQAKLNAAIAALRQGRGRGAHRTRRGARRPRPHPGRRGRGTRMISDGCRMISGVSRRRLRRAPGSGMQLTVRKAVMHDIAPILRPHQRLRRQGHHAAAHRVRNVGDHPRFHRGHCRTATCSAAARCTSTAPPWARSARSRCTSTPRPTAWDAGSWKRWSRRRSDYDLDAVFAFTYVVDFFNKVGFHAGGAGRSAAEGVEGLPALPEIPGLRRDRHAAHSSARAVGESHPTCGRAAPDGRRRIH